MNAVIESNYGIQINTQAVKQIIKEDGEILTEKYDAHILADKGNGTLSIILQTSPKLGMSIRINDITKIVKIECIHEILRKIEEQEIWAEKSLADDKAGYKNAIEDGLKLAEYTILDELKRL
mgnify:CR=1 FL=1